METVGGASSQVRLYRQVEQGYRRYPEVPWLSLALASSWSLSFLFFRDLGAEVRHQAGAWQLDRDG